MSEKIEARDIIQCIMKGQLDEELDRVIEAARARVKIAATTRVLMLGVGSRVEFGPRTRPQYMRGLQATIRSIQGKNAVVDLDAPCRRFFRGVRVPHELLMSA